MTRRRDTRPIATAGTKGLAAGFRADLRDARRIYDRAAGLRGQWTGKLLAAGYTAAGARQALEQIVDAQAHPEDEMLQRAANGPRRVIGRAVWVDREPYLTLSRAALQSAQGWQGFATLAPLDCRGCVRRIYGRLL